MSNVRLLKGALFILLSLGALVVFKCTILDATEPATTQTSRLGSVVETSEEQLVAVSPQYPRVFVAPIPSELHWDLLNCSLAPLKAGELWFVNDDDAIRFQESSPAHPFGKLIQHPELAYHYTPSHPSGTGEYDFQAYYYQMIQGYFNRVDSLEIADLIYVPYFKRRLKCHLKGEKTARELIHNHVEWYMRKYPSKTFFTASGGVCSCGHPECLPIKAWEAPDLAKKFRVLAWERDASLPEKEGNVVVPYVTQLHEMAWAVEDPREVLVLAIMGIRNKNSCVICGPCNKSPTDNQCLPQCKSIRAEIIEHLRTRNKENDIALWTSMDNPSTKWFPNGTNFWPPVQTLSKTMLSTFCLQPAGDTLSRKSFFESIQAGCIPVVFRNDDQYLEQLPFSSIIPYREMYYYVPESCVVQESCFIENNNTIVPAKSFVDVLRSVPHESILRRRQLIKQYGRMLLFSSHDGVNGGYNDVGDPDAFLMSLRETWRLARL